MRPKKKRLTRGLPMFFVLTLTGMAIAACGGTAGPGVASAPKHSNGSETPGKGTTHKGTTASSSSSGDGKGGPIGGTIGMGGVTLQFANCMRTHGVANFPDPNSRGQVTFNVDPNSTSFQAAQKACAKFSPGGGRTPSPAQQAKMLANALKFARCMRAHGLPDFPDPTTGPNGGIGFSIRVSRGSGMNPNSAAFQNAQRACQGFGPKKLR